LNEIKKIFEEKYKKYLTTTTISLEKLVEEDSNFSRSYFWKKLKLSRNNNNITDNILNIYLNISEKNVDPLI